MLQSMCCSYGPRSRISSILQRGRVSEPKNKPFKAVVDSIRNPMLIPQLHAFIAIAKATTLFLTKYRRTPGCFLSSKETWKISFEIC